MSLSIEEKKDQRDPTPITEVADYPYGLRIHVDHETFKKLGLNGTPSINQKMKLVANVEVVNVSSDKGEGDMRKHEMTLQITEMDLISGSVKESESPADGKSTADTLFGG